MMMKKMYEKNTQAQTRWASFENPSALKGAGGTQNDGAKGMAYQSLEAGEEKVLLNIGSSGIINRVWITVSDRSEEMLSSLMLKFYWDNSSKPAVCTPFGDFFCAQAGNTKPFESHLFSNPEGKSYNCFIQMPFLTGAKIVISNNSDKRLSHLFYDINYTLLPLEKDNILYFHAIWNRENTTELCKDYTILEKLYGNGRFLGVSFYVYANPLYAASWFGEGEMKFYLDGDSDYPTLCGTGTEDYIGTGWGQGEYAHMSQGCLLSNSQNGRYVFYRFHVCDPIFFQNDIRVCIQNIGGASRETMLAIKNAKAPYKIVSHDNTQTGIFTKLYRSDFDITEASEDGWYNFYREDDYSSVAYFYLDRASV